MCLLGLTSRQKMKSLFSYRSKIYNKLFLVFIIYISSIYLFLKYIYLTKPVINIITYNTHVQIINSPYTLIHIQQISFSKAYF